uniref:ATP synthase F0 subunit 6 n=1 Tax=Scurria scurra TaxID=351200 RepID=UPI001EDF5393|nr:ATP synthase F0 subunit 6 [Scurria scurra]UHY95070.1 ATP synthase F0 subunit 6 [Scurria scurra]
MLADLFTIFDSQTYINQSGIFKSTAFWGFSLLLPVAFPAGQWLSGSTFWNQFIRPVVSWAWHETALVVKDSGSALIFVSAGWMMASTIYWQITPGVFLALAHPALTACVAFSLWSAMILAAALTCSNQFLAGFVPDGCPNFMAPPLVVVEVFSHIMRPLALCGRLSLTVSVGHIIMALVSGFVSESMFKLDYLSDLGNFWSGMKNLGSSLNGKETLIMVNEFLSYTSGQVFKPFVLMGLSCFLTLVELGISALQAYIFFTLLLFFNTQYPRCC